MSRKYKVAVPGKFYFITFAAVSWIDVFARKHYRYLLLDNLHYCQQLQLP